MPNQQQPSSAGQVITFPLAVLLFMLALYALLRIALLAYTGIDQVPLLLWPAVMVKGIWFDVVVGLTLLAPVLVYEALIPNRLRTSALHAKLRLLWLFASVSVLLFGAVSEFTFWIEFSTRLNFIALDYLIYTSEVIGNIRESYPVGWIFGAIALVGGLVTWAMKARLLAAMTAPITMTQRAALVALAIALPTGLLWSSSVEQMEGLKNAYADELSGNGLFTLAAAARRNELDYQKFYRTMPADSAASTLKRLGVSRESEAGLQRASLQKDAPASTAQYFTRTPKNLVLVSIESLSASFLDSYGATRNLTPRLDQLAREGLRFDRLFATGTRTVRGLEALSLGTPPVPGQAIVRRPNNEHLNTLGEILEHQGFDTYFMYGGYGYFDNMNAYFKANDYQVIDRTDIPKEKVVFENVWGVADEVLFNTVIDQLDKRSDTSRPFFAHVMTTTNHRPFTYPDGRIDIPSPGGRNGAVRYTDYAIGKFIDDAKSHPWFKDTLFVFVADHCASVAGKTSLPVKSYHIPLILYSPGNLKPGVHDKMLSQIDIVPTLVDALGQKGSGQFFGQSIFRAASSGERAFISNYQELGYLKNGTLTVLLPKRRVQSFHIDPQTLESTPAPVDEKLLAEAIAYYQSASADFRSGRLRAPFYQNASVKVPMQ